MTLLIKRLIIFVLSISLFFTSTPVYAATIRSGESVDVPESETNLRDGYFFGETITVDGPIENDLTTAGGSLTLNGDISGSLLAAGGDIVIRSRIGNTMRVAGGDIVISGPVENDVVLAAGNARITKTASISGDLIFAGGRLQVEGPVQGRIYMYGGDITLNSAIGGRVEGEVGKLTIGNAAVLTGDLVYRSEEKAEIKSGADLQGKHEFKKSEKRQETPQGVKSAFTAGSFYKLVTDIVIAMLLITFLPILVKKFLENSIDSPVSSAGTGFLFLAFWPLLSVFLLLFFWLGVISFMIYGLVLLVALFVGKIFLGWLLLTWWEKQSKRTYVLDWKAAIVGPVVMFILFLIPIIGWLAAFIIFLIATGSIVKSMFTFAGTQRERKIVKAKK